MKNAQRQFLAVRLSTFQRSCPFTAAIAWQVQHLMPPKTEVLFDKSSLSLLSNGGKATAPVTSVLLSPASQKQRFPISLSPTTRQCVKYILPSTMKRAFLTGKSKVRRVEVPSASGCRAAKSSASGAPPSNELCGLTGEWALRSSNPYLSMFPNLAENLRLSVFVVPSRCDDEDGDQLMERFVRWMEVRCPLTDYEEDGEDELSGLEDLENVYEEEADASSYLWASFDIGAIKGVLRTKIKPLPAGCHPAGRALFTWRARGESGLIEHWENNVGWITFVSPTEFRANLHSELLDF